MTGGPLESVSDNNREFKAIRGERRSLRAAADPTARQLTACYFRQQAAGGQSPREACGGGGVGVGEGGAATVDDAQAVFIYALCCCYSSSCDFRRSSLKAQR